MRPEAKFLYTKAVNTPWDRRETTQSSTYILSLPSANALLCKRPHFPLCSLPQLVTGTSASYQPQREEEAGLLSDMICGFGISDAFSAYVSATQDRTVNGSTIKGLFPQGAHINKIINQINNPRSSLGRSNPNTGPIKQKPLLTLTCSWQLVCVKVGRKKKDKVVIFFTRSAYQH